MLFSDLSILPSVVDQTSNFQHVKKKVVMKTYYYTDFPVEDVKYFSCTSCVCHIYIYMLKWQILKLLTLPQIFLGICFISLQISIPDFQWKSCALDLFHSLGVPPV